MSENEIIKAWEWHLSPVHSNGMKIYSTVIECSRELAENTLSLINLNRTEIDILIRKKETLRDEIDRKDVKIMSLKHDIERLQKIIVGFMDEVGTWSNKYDVDVSNIHRLPLLAKEDLSIRNNIKSEAIKEFVEKVTEVFMQYAHLHNYADQARVAQVESVDGTKIEMQSVWDVLTLKKHDMAEYEEMGELQHNIEYIANDRLLTELEKDFRLLVKEMTENERKV